jgi:methylmalonyl-CoA mutase, N-terminal domain
MTIKNNTKSGKKIRSRSHWINSRRGKSASRPGRDRGPAGGAAWWWSRYAQPRAGWATRAVYPEVGFPGEYPYTRGVQPTMYRSRFWTMRQYAGFSTAEESNKRYRYLLGQGQTGLSVAFDLPTQIGYDADDPIAQGEVGKVGVSISSIKDMEQLFDQIPLDKVSTSMTINAPAGVLLAMYIAVAKRQGADMKQLRGTIQNDILKEYVARGTYIFPPAPSMRLITDIFSFCSKEVPFWNTISISGYHIREAGSTPCRKWRSRWRMASPT